jgi:phospholipid/cholesterol/gamma-HCH transport system substrate-binding protein
MQSLKVRDILRNPIAWGIGALALGTVIALVLAYVYIHPPAQKLVSFYTDDAASIKPGEDVRMAGIRVGKVEDLSLEANRVLVRTRVDDDAFVGDKSQVEVRMLTVVGGYYVNINSIGDEQLGVDPIPQERVTMPYNLMRALTDTTKITENLTAKPINQSLNEVQRGLTGTNVQALSAVIDAGNSVMSTIERQQGQVTAILDMSNKYIQAVDGYREKFADLVRKTSILSQSLVVYVDGLRQSQAGLGEIVQVLRPVGEFYDRHRAEFIEKVRQYQHKVRLFVERSGVTVRALQRLQNLFERVLDGQNARPALLATDLCMPVPGSQC